ncbi:MAG: hypothetical protein RBR74_10065 [Ignavibacteriaceae bacterium]|jgi:hypothetical protein|nr:hypothetical protein [Ignavibacteriaceae bacterium]
MKNFLQFITVLFLSAIICTQLSFAQTAGDYRSNAATGNWNAAGSWEYFDGTVWGTTLNYPGLNPGAGNVEIQPGHTITINSSIAYSIGALTVNGEINTNGSSRILNVANDVNIIQGVQFH